MSSLQYTKPIRVPLKSNSEYTERWLQNMIKEDPSILGLGDLVLKDTERMQPKAGRLDLLFQDAKKDKRYEVEIMLGSVDESHIIRCIEYWDIERKRLPGYEHYAVIVAEDITSRFLNVISLLNGTIPLIALQLTAFQVDNKIMLVFTKVLDSVSQVAEEDESAPPKTDRSYWEKRGSQASMKLLDRCLEIIREYDPNINLNYNKYYIGLAKNGLTNNFVIFDALKKFLRVSIRVADLEALKAKLAGSIEGEISDRRVSFLLITEADLETNKALIAEVLEGARQESLK